MHSGHSDVPHAGSLGVHMHHAGGGYSDDAMPNKSASMSSKLHYSDAGPHREMAVDCPANFVGVKKEPPRMPRPVSHAGSSLSVMKGSQTSLASPTKTQYTIGGSSPSVHAQAANVSELADPMGTPARLAFSRDERDRSERLRRYQEELAKRREMEDRANQEQQQLRASLRGSKKMQDLAEKRTKANVAAHDGFDNPNYCVDDGDDKQLLDRSDAVHSKSNVSDGHTVEHMSKSFSSVQFSFV